MRTSTVTSKITTMAEANPDTPTSQAVLTPTSTEPPRQLTREELIKTRKSELQTLCREMGLNNVWARKDQLIKMILDKSQPVPAPDTVHLATTASATATTNNTDTSHSLRHNTAPLLRHPDQTAQPLLREDQPILDQTTCQLRLDTAPELRPDDDTTHSSVNIQNTQPQPQDTRNPNGVTLDPLRDEHGQPQHSTNDSLPTSSAFDIQDDMTEIEIRAIARDVKKIIDKSITKDLELELLNEEVKTAYQVISTLQQRVTVLEQRNITCIDEQPQPQTDSPPVSHCLLLGDSNLRRVLSSDLGDNCSVKTINGANIDSIRRWIQDRLNKTPTECVLYCGISDVLDESPHEIILDNIGALVSELKEKNCNMKIFVCQIVPPCVSQDLKENIESFNEHLLKWGETNGISILKTTPNFKLGTGEIDDLCFENDANSAVLSRIGIVRLLDTVANQCSEFKICKNWKEVKKALVNLPLLKPPSVSALPPPAGQPPPPLSAPSSSSAAPGPAPSARGAAPPVTPCSTGPRVATAGHRAALLPPPHPSGPVAAPFYLSHPPGHGVAPHSPHGLAGTGAAQYHPPYPVGHIGTPQPTPSVPLPSAASNSPPYVTAPAAAHNYYRSNEGIPSRAAAQGGTHVWGPNSARHSSPRQESGHTAPHYPPSSEGTRHAWQPRGAFRGVPPAVRTMQWRERVPHSRGTSHTTSVDWRWSDNYNQDTGPASYHYTNTATHPAIHTTTHKGIRRGCYNCGEFNHHKENCRFDHLLRCGLCNQLGHKQRLCHYYST